MPIKSQKHQSMLAMPWERCIIHFHIVADTYTPSLIIPRAVCETLAVNSHSQFIIMQCVVLPAEYILLVQLQPLPVCEYVLYVCKYMCTLTHCTVHWETDVQSASHIMQHITNMKKSMHLL